MSAAFLPMVSAGSAPNPADAVQATDPTPQTQVAAGAASVTFSSPTGGDGSYSYSATLYKPGGSSATLSGSGLGAYSFTTDATGIYAVVLTVTDGVGFETTATGVVSLVKDYLPPSAPTRQDLTAGTTSANVDFGRATGQTTSGTPAATIDKPSGSSASVSVSDTGSAWRVAVSSMADGEAYRVVLAFTASDGQVCYQSAIVTVGADTVDGWELVADWDFTDAGNTPSSGSGVGTYTLALAAGNVTLQISNSSGGTPLGAFVLDSSGLQVTVSKVSGTIVNATISLDLAAFLGFDPKLDLNMWCFEALIQPVTMSTTNDFFNFEVADNPVSASASPGFYLGLSRVSSSNYTTKVGGRQLTSSSNSAGSTLSTSLPSYLHVQLIGMGYNYMGLADMGAAVSAPFSITTYRGSCGVYSAKTPSDTAPNYWGSACNLVFNGTISSTAVVFKILQIRAFRMTPAQ